MKWALFIVMFCAAFNGFSQNKNIDEVLANVDKGNYVVLEVRMQLEDEFQTVEGNESANLSRLAIFTGKNKGKEILSKGFSGYNSVVEHMNQIKSNGFKLNETYSIKGNSLMITHYVFEKAKR